MAVPYSPTALANNFIEQFGEAHGIEHMKLQKLVYCAYGWWLATNGIKGIRLTNDGPEIWEHGPVFSSLYQNFRVFGRSKVTVPQSGNPFNPPENIDADDKPVRNFIGWIWGRYGHLSGFALSDLTHKQGTPWHRVAVDNNFRVTFHTKIPDQYIFEEFSNLLNATKNLNQENGTQNGGTRIRA